MAGDKNILDTILSALGFNPTQLRWRWRRRKQVMSNWFKRAENRSRAARYEHKTCHACNAPVDREERVCPRCGASLASASADRVGRLIRLLVPEGAKVYTTLMGLIIVALFGAMVMQGGAEMLWPGSSEAVKKQLLISLNLGASHVGYFDRARLCHDLRIYDLANLCPEFPHVHRLVTSMFVHFGIMHFLFNIYALLQLGPLMEDAFGRSKFLVLYFLSGVCGSLVSLVYHWNTPVTSAGASGALFGLIGASLVYGWKVGGAFGRSLTSEMLKWGIFALLASVLIQADNAAHIGGAVAGAGLAYVIPDKTMPTRIHPNVWLVLEMLCLLALVGSFVALFTLDDPVYALMRKVWFKG